jgi:hypothetical protein
VILFVLIVLLAVLNSKQESSVSYGSGDDADDDDDRHRFAEPLPPSWGNQVRRHDRNFSEVLFLERAVLLVSRLFDAAPKASLLTQLSPYITAGAADELQRRHAGVQQVRGVTIGSVAITGVNASSSGGALQISVRLHLNRHVVLSTGKETSYYSDEVWRFGRALGEDVITRTDDTVDRFGCPGCGSTLEADVHGRCVHCQTVLAPAGADWALSGFQVLRQEDVGPLLGSTVEEVGTDAPTSKDSAVLMDADRLLGADERSRLLVRARDVFTTLQAAWSQQKLEGMRPFETDALFQSHRFWVLEYQRQRLKNQIDNVDVEAVELCRVQKDGAHMAATLRITASCIDTTVDASGKRISGNPRVPRRFSEYWTFVKHADAKGSSSLVNCPNCGAPLQVSQAGVCEHCQSKLTLGRFDWVASRIEQDEDISGA